MKPTFRNPFFSDCVTFFEELWPINSKQCHAPQGILTQTVQRY